MPRLLWNNCCVRSGGRYYSSEGSIIISIERGFQITIICFDPTTTTDDMTESISCCGKVYRSFDKGYVVRWRRVKMGGGDYLKIVQLSSLNKLSDELSCGLMWRVQAEILSWR